MTFSNLPRNIGSVHYRMDFSMLTMKPKPSNRAIKGSTWHQTLSRGFCSMSVSSVWMIMWTPRLLRNTDAGFRTLVNAQGAQDSLNPFPVHNGQWTGDTSGVLKGLGLWSMHPLGPAWLTNHSELSTPARYEFPPFWNVEAIPMCSGPWNLPLTLFVPPFGC